jgi:hypothetical protein
MKTKSDTSKLKQDILRGMKLSSKKLKAKKKLLGRRVAVSERGVVKILESKEIK